MTKCDDVVITNNIHIGILCVCLGEDLILGSTEFHILVRNAWPCHLYSRQVR